MQIDNEASQIELQAYNTLKKVIDPELGINIIDMGLIYTIKYRERNSIYISMTLSSEGCPMGEIIMNDIYSVLTDAFPELKPEIELTWTPKWTSEFITPEGRKLLDIAPKGPLYKEKNKN